MSRGRHNARCLLATLLVATGSPSPRIPAPCRSPAARKAEGRPMPPSRFVVSAAVTSLGTLVCAVQPAAQPPEPSRIDLRISEPASVHMRVRTLASDDERDRPAHSLDAAVDLCREVGALAGPRLWALIDPLIAEADNLDDIDTPRASIDRLFGDSAPAIRDALDRYLAALHLAAKQDVVRLVDFLERHAPADQLVAARVHRGEPARRFRSRRINSGSWWLALRPSGPGRDSGGPH